MLTNAVVIGGLGVVGKATRKMFDIPHYFDLNGSNVTLKEASEKKFIFVTVPTPSQQKGYDTTALFEIVKQIVQLGGGHIIINRCTVIPGTADNMMDQFGTDAIVSNPEFLTMSTINADVKNPDIVVLGGRNKQILLEVERLYRSKYGSKPHYMIGTNKEAEIFKLFVNVFYATKVILANELYDICELEGIDYTKIYQNMYKRKWIGNNHLNALHGESRGAKGPCLEKDLEAFATTYNKPLTSLANKINHEF